MKNTPQFLLALIGLLILLVGCGSIDSVPLPDNSPDDATTNAGADPTDEAGEATGAEDGDSFARRCRIRELCRQPRLRPNPASIS